MGHCCTWEVEKVGYNRVISSIFLRNDKLLQTKVIDSERIQLNLF